MWGAISPIKLIVPTNETAKAAKKLIRSNEVKRSRCTLMPKLAARSSPKRKAVSRHESRIANGKIMAMAINMAPTLGHVARDKLPMVQNTNDCKSSALAINCIKDTSALNENTSAMPNSTSPELLIEPQRATASSNRAENTAKIKALLATIHACGKPGIDKFKIIAKDAPKAAAEEMPSVNGLAKGLFRIVCISAPASPKASPTATAIME